MNVTGWPDPSLMVGGPVSAWGMVWCTIIVALSIGVVLWVLSDRG